MQDQAMTDDSTVRTVVRGSPTPSYVKATIEQFKQETPQKSIERLESFGNWLIGTFLTLYSGTLLGGFRVLKIQPDFWFAVGLVFVVGSVAIVVLGKTPRDRGDIVDAHDAADIRRFYNEIIKMKSSYFRAAGILMVLGVFLLIPSILQSAKKESRKTNPTPSLSLAFKKAKAGDAPSLDVTLNLKKLRERSRAEIRLVGCCTITEGGEEGQSSTLFVQDTKVVGGDEMELKLPRILVGSLKSFTLEVSLFDDGKQPYYHQTSVLTLPPKQAPN